MVCVLGGGLGLRAYSLKRSGLTTVTVSRDVAEVVSREAVERLRPHLEEGQRIMVAARGITPVLRFAFEEAQLRKATLYVLYVKEIAVFVPSGPTTVEKSRWQDDPHAQAIMSLMMKMGVEQRVNVMPVYLQSQDAASTILDLAATIGIDYLMIGSSHRLTMTKLLKGDVVEKVAAGLPEDIQLIIHG